MTNSELESWSAKRLTGLLKSLWEPSEMRRLWKSKRGLSKLIRWWSQTLSAKRKVDKEDGHLKWKLFKNFFVWTDLSNKKYYTLSGRRRPAKSWNVLILNAVFVCKFFFLLHVGRIVNTSWIYVNKTLKSFLRIPFPEGVE